MTKQTRRIRWTVTELMALRDPFLAERTAGRNSHDALRAAQRAVLPQDRWRAVNGNSIRALHAFIDNDPIRGIIRDALKGLKRAGVKFVLGEDDLKVKELLQLMSDPSKR